MFGWFNPYYRNPPQVNAVYIDNWYQTPPERRLYLEHICEEPDCSHARYLHGSVREVWAGYHRVIEHTEGYCMIASCACKTFHADPPITKDEVLDLHVALRYDVHMGDVGIEPWIEAVMCKALILRQTGRAVLQLFCVRDKGHDGDHTYKK